MARRHDRPSELLDPASRPPPLPATTPGAAADIDILSDVLRTVKLTGALFFPLRASSPWTNEVPPAPAFAPALLPAAQHVVSYHIVTGGGCWATLRQGPPVRLETGDVLVVPHGDRYVMSSEPDARGGAPADATLSFFREMASGSAPVVVTEGGGGPDGAALVCGFLGCDLRPFNPVLGALPRLVHLPHRREARDRLHTLVEFALAESRERRSGAQCVLLRLSELLFVEVIRRYVDRLTVGQSGWLAGLRDPMVGHALALLHDRPAEGWTLERLAKGVGASRSALADRFTHFVGDPPMRYLTQWRIQLAARLLSDGTAKVSAIASDVGYESEEAFSRSFKKLVGVSPVSWRRRFLPSG